MRAVNTNKGGVRNLLSTVRKPPARRTLNVDSRYEKSPRA